MLIELPPAWLPTTINGCMVRLSSRRRTATKRTQLRLLERTLRLKPGNIPAQLKLADAFFKLDRLDEAAHYFEMAAQAPGSNAALQANFGLGRIAAATA